MNHSIFSADRATHLKIMIVTLLAAIVVSALGVAVDRSKTIAGERYFALKAGRPMTVTSSSIVLTH